MKITDLKVAGFKSFVDPVHLRIEQGLTGIVGPNGCGKSNVLESLRWVMGATSARALRGGEMDDVIFSGTDLRPGRDIAEVSIILDNSEGLAPAPFTTAPALEIVRRIKRGAGSSFRINGKEVRARDVQMIFADASTGANSPALVRQNQVSELINAKPENRRRILEEAAGIAGLYARRHEAELKLRGAETNLERLDEILKHMDDQLVSLRKQAKQAARYRALADEIRALEAFLFARRLSDAQRQSEARKAELEAAERALADANIAATAALKASEASEVGINPLREEQAIADAVLRKLDGRRFECERDLKAAEEALGAADAELRRIAADKVRETSLLEDAATTLARLQAEFASLSGSASRQDELEAAQNALDQASLTQADADTKLAGLMAQKAGFEAQRQALDQAVKEAQAQVSRRTEALNRAQAAVQAIEASLPDATALAQARLEATEAGNRAEEAAERADSAERAAEAAVNLEAATREDSRLAQNARDRLFSEIAALEASTRKPQTGQWSRALEVTRPKPGYERALAAALGEDLEAALDPKAPIAWTGSTSQPVQWPASIEPLAQFVDAPDALQARLAAIGIVGQANFDGLGQLPMGARVVTQAGDLKRWDGYVRRANAVSSAAVVLEQRNHLAALKEQLPEVESKASAAAKANAAARAEADRSRALARNERINAPRAFAELSNARERVSRMEADHARAEANLSQASAQALAAQQEFEAAQMLLHDAQDRATQLQGQDDLTLQEAIVAASAAADLARQDVRNAGRRFSDIEADIKTSAQRQERLQADLSLWVRRQTEANERLAKLETESIGALAKRDAARDAPKAVEARRQTILAEAPKAEARKRAADDALAQAETLIRTSREAARHADAALSERREQRAGAAIRLQAAQDRSLELTEEIRRTLQIAPDECERRARAALGDAYDGLTVEASDARLARLLRDRDSLGGVNLRADEEAVEQEARVNALVADKDDLLAAIAKLRGGVDEINAEGKDRLIAAFDKVHAHFRTLFETLFDGGTAELRLTESDDPLGGGLEVYACPPGKKLQSMALMSGGEQALTASALIFAVFLSNPSPICVLDEVDAPLDDSNVDRYCRLLDEMRQRTNTRFIVITHHPITMARMDRLFGVTMAERGVSQVVAVDLKRAEALIS